MSLSPESVQNLFVQIVFGCITAYLAKERGRSPPIWFLVGFFAGIIGLVVLLLFPSMITSGKKIAEPLLDPIAIPPHAESAPAEPEMSGWFYLDEQYQSSGPHPFSLIVTRWQQHELDRSSYLWREGMSDWKKIEELPEVIAKLEPEGAPPPP